MLRFFNIYCPTRTLLLVAAQIMLIFLAFTVAGYSAIGADWQGPFVDHDWALRVTAITAIVLLLAHYFDMYSPDSLIARGQVFFRLLAVIGILSILLSAVTWFYPDLAGDTLLLGLVLMTVLLVLLWVAYYRLASSRIFREKVYILGSGQRAQEIAALIRNRPDAGMEVVVADPVHAALSDIDRLAEELASLDHGNRRPDRIILAMEDRRGTIPVAQLLNLRVRGVAVEDANSLIERMCGKLPLSGLYPSNLIFAEGFSINAGHQMVRRMLSFLVAAVALLICLPFIPFIMLAVKLSSPGPVFFSQNRVGKNGRIIRVHKFRTMRQDAEANGAVWAVKNDPRVTRVGMFMRKTRLDEIPQLWNVLCGDMAFVGPRPERPEFVSGLSKNIPYYDLRHIVRPGLTGWAQVRYRYGASVEDARNKLEFDLYFLKHLSITLDLFIMFETIKTILLRRGAQ